MAERGEEIASMPIVYILYSESRNRFYTGSSRTDNPSERLKRHDGGYVTSTKSGRPWLLINVEFFKSYTEARKRELYLKTGVGRKGIKECFGSHKSRRGTQEAEGGRLLIS